MLPNKVTVSDINQRIVNERYIDRPFDTTLTICILTLDNGINVTGESACIDPANFNQEMGRKIARDNAFDKLWFPMGFVLADKRKDAP